MSLPPPPGPPPPGRPPQQPRLQPQVHPQGQPPPPGYLALTIQGNVMTSNMLTPAVRLNGYDVPASYGQNVLPLPPGRWRVDVHARWWREYGQASMDVDLAPGQTVPVFYAAPLHVFTTGLIGHVKQPRKGLIAFLLIMVAMLAMSLGVIALVFGVFAISVFAAT